VKVINGHVNVLVDDDGVVRTARELVEGLVEAGKHIAKTESELRASLQALHKMATVAAQAKGRITELESALAGFTEEAPINWDAASIPQSVPFDPENQVHRNQAVGSMSVGYARIYAARKLLNLPKPGVEGE